MEDLKAGETVKAATGRNTRVNVSGCIPDRPWEHEFAEHTCQDCYHQTCAACCSFDSRGDNSHDGDRPILTCKNCGANVLQHQWPKKQKENI